MMFQHLPFDAAFEQYSAQATELLAAFRDGDEDAVRVMHSYHPRFRDSRVPWLVIEGADVRSAEFGLADAELTVARGYFFRDWAALVTYAASGPDVMRFEAAVEATVDGDLAALRKLLSEDPGLVGARSKRVNCFDPPVHGATLLHYLVANGTEHQRQRTPKNAVEIGRALLEAGADADALANLYGGQCTVMSMLVSSCHPANVGVQEPLIELLVDFGASVEPRGEGNWASPIITALVFGYKGAAETLVKRGARVDNMVTAAGLDRTDEVRAMLPAADTNTRHQAFSLAAQLGNLETARLLLAAGEDPNRYNPEAFHKHCTPLHQVALRGDLAMAKLLVAYGARADIEDTVYESTAIGWAHHSGKSEIEKFLRTHC